jgi:hypothetical protein
MPNKEQFHQNRLKMFGIFSLFLLAACTAPPQKLSPLYFPENTNPPRNPDHSITLANGSTLDFYNLDNTNRIFSDEEMQKQLNPHCQNPIDDKKIPVYFTKNSPCDNDSNLGCTKRDPSTNEQYVQIGAKKINTILKSLKSMKAVYCQDQKYFSNSKNTSGFKNCDNAILEQNPTTIINGTTYHEIAKHVCDPKATEQEALDAEKNYIIEINQKTEESRQMIEETK